MSGNGRYFGPYNGARWAISVPVGNRWVSLVEGCCLDDPSDKEAILHALYIDPSDIEQVEQLFINGDGRPRPTLELLEHFAPAEFKKRVVRGESGV